MPSQLAGAIGIRTQSSSPVSNGLTEYGIDLKELGLEGSPKPYVSRSAPRTSRDVSKELADFDSDFVFK